jgi:hypothetical protein
MLPIGSAAEVPGELTVAGARAAALTNPEARERVEDRKLKQEDLEAAHWEEALVAGLEGEPRALCATGPKPRIILKRMQKSSIGSPPLCRQ